MDLPWVFSHILFLVKTEKSFKLKSQGLLVYKLFFFFLTEKTKTMSEEKNKVSILCPYKRLLPDSISVTLWITVTASQTTLVLQKESFCFFCDLTACSPLFVTIALQATDFSAPGSCSLPPLPHVEFRSFSPQQLIHLLTKNSLPSWRHSFFLQQKYLLP